MGPVCVVCARPLHTPAWVVCPLVGRRAACWTVGFGGWTQGGDHCGRWGDDLGWQGEVFHSQEGWWRRPRPPRKWDAIVEGKATIATPFSAHQPGLLGQWQGHTLKQAQPPLKPGFPPTTEAPASLLGCWA